MYVGQQQVYVGWVLVFCIEKDSLPQEPDFGSKEKTKLSWGGESEMKKSAMPSHRKGKGKAGRQACVREQRTVHEDVVLNTERSNAALLCCYNPNPDC